MGRGRAPCCDKSKVRAGPWSPAEDLRLINFIQKHGHSNWRALPRQAGLLRCGKSCRLRWINYLRPDVKRGNFTPEEEQTIINLHNSLGNKWSKIASYLPGRTDNEIKNVWNTNLKKRLTGGKVEDANGEAAKDPKRAAVASSSAPQSCTSCSSITTSRDDYTDTTTWLYGIGGGVQDHSEAAENHMKFPESPIEDHIESGGQLTASSSSVYHSTASFYVPSCMQQLEDNNNNMLVLEASESSESRPSSNDHPLEGCADDDRVIQLPTEPDRDFWKLLDSVDPLLDEPTDQSTNYNGENHQEQDAKFDVEEVELNKWLNFLENELGLTSCTTGGDHNQMHIPDEGNKQQDDQIMGNLGPEIIATDHDQTSSDYFPLWPLSPLN